MVALTAAACLALPSLSLAGPLVEAATKAEQQAADGDPNGAFSTLREAVGEFSSGLPFSVGTAVFVTEKPAAYGAYSPRADSRFNEGEPLITYVELIGLSWEKTEDTYRANFTVDLEVLDSKGEQLAAQKNFGKFDFTGRVRNQEIFTHLTLDLAGASPGSYTVKYTINDTLAGHFTTVEQAFTVTTGL